MKIISLFLLIILSFGSLHAQMSIEDIVYGRVWPQSLSQLQWQADEDQISWYDQKSHDLLCQTVKGKQKILICRKDLNQITGREHAFIPPVNWLNEERFWYQDGDDIILVDLDEKKSDILNQVPAGSELVELSPNHRIASVLANNIMVKLPGEAARQITQDGSRQIAYGDAAHRYEFGIDRGLFWSPNSQKLAFYRVDQSMVTDYAMVDFSTTPASPKPEKYPMAGQNSHHATIGVYDVKSQSTIYLETGEPADQYLTNITWHPNGKSIYVAVVNRDQNQMELKVFDAETGVEEAVLFEEKDDEYVEPEHGPIFLEDDKGFLWFSERDGYQHLYHYQENGELIGAITAGDWEVTELLAITNKEVFYLSTEESPLERHLYAVSLDGEKKRKMTNRGRPHAVVRTPKTPPRRVRRG
ncbi:MAG: DPP IV N-terminal domain-containing protein, partial [Bacteroidota bacterium]